MWAQSMYREYLWLFSHSVMSNSLWFHGLQHTRPPCPSPLPGVCSDSCSLSQWCHPSMSSYVVPFSSVFSLSQHQGLFQWVSSSHQVAKGLDYTSTFTNVFQVVLFIFPFLWKSFHSCILKILIQFIWLNSCPVLVTNIRKLSKQKNIRLCHVQHHRKYCFI